MPSTDSFIGQPDRPEMPTGYTDLQLLSATAGGYAVLYRARHLGKWVVLKALKEPYRDNATYLALLQKEFELGYLLNHPHIVRTLDWVETPDTGPAIVMEYVDGQTLKQTIAQGGITVEEIKRVAVQLCSAVDYLHSRQIIHRDLKPSNILITAHGRNVKVIDFGCSDADDYAILKQPAGTRRYAAPELFTADSPIDGRADIYSIGIILGEMNATLPRRDRRLTHVAQRCCKVNPDARYPTAQAAADRLKKERDTHLWAKILLPLLLAAAVVVGFVSLQSPDAMGTRTSPSADTTQHQQDAGAHADRMQHNADETSALPEQSRRSEMSAPNRGQDVHAPSSDTPLGETEAASDRGETDQARQRERERTTRFLDSIYGEYGPTAIHNARQNTKQ